MGKLTIIRVFSIAMLNLPMDDYLLVLNAGNGWVAGGCWDD